MLLNELGVPGVALPWVGVLGEEVVAVQSEVEVDVEASSFGDESGGRDMCFRSVMAVTVLELFSFFGASF